MLTDILWSFLIIATMWQVFKRLLKMGKKVKPGIELDFFEDEISK